MIKIYENVVQGTDEWFELRRGILTASTMKSVLTPTLKMASNDKERQHLYDIVAERITKRVEPTFQNDEMLAGHEAEFDVKNYYLQKNTEPQTVGFITNCKLGFDMGYSPDGIIGTDGLIEIKKRRAKYIAEYILTEQVPDDHMLQIQTGLFISERAWCDYLPYCAGLPLVPLRIYPDPKYQSAIELAAIAFEKRVGEAIKLYHEKVLTNNRAIPTTFKTYGEIEL